MMGITDTLFGRRMSREEKEEYNRVREAERSKRFRELKMAEARKRAKDDAQFEAGGGLFGAFGRGVQNAAKSGVKTATKKAKEKASKEWKKKKPSGYMNPLMPTSQFTSGVAFQPNTDWNMPIGLKKRRD